MPKAPRTEAVTRSCGTLTSLRRAMTDSTTPMTIAIRSIPATKPAHSRIGSGEPNGKRTCRRRAPQDEELHRGAPEDRPEGRPAVVEDHHLVDHRQLEVRVRVVEGDPAVLGEEDDPPAHRDENEGRPPLEPPLAPGVGEHPPEGEAPREAGEDEHAEDEGRLGEAPEAHLAGRPHPLEGGPGVQGRGGSEEAREAEEVDEEDDVSREGDGGFVAAERDELPRQERHGEPDRRPGPEDPRRRPAEDRALSEELQDVVVGLQERRPDPPGEDGLRLPDHAEEERREEEQEDFVDGEVDRVAHFSRSLQTRDRRRRSVATM